MTVRSYETPAAFKQALEQRLRNASSSGADLARRRQILVFDRFLARLVEEHGNAVTLKGGLALELRLDRARTTKDIDVRMMGAPGAVLESLRAAARRDLGDFLQFTVHPDESHAVIPGDGLKYDGFRFKARCTLAGKIYGHQFGVDVAFGDPIFGEPDLIAAADSLGFAGIAPPILRVYPIETHIAEKLHALTLPRSRPNSRIKDLPDLALIASTGSLTATKVRAAIEQTFAFRDTHQAPLQLPDPPPSWTAPYAALARANDLRWATLEEVAKAAKAFLDPVLGFEHEAQWEPTKWAWLRSPGPS